MKKLIALTLAVLLALSSLTALAEVYKDKPTIKAVQQALNDAGYNCGTPDGSAGKKTRAAIESYQTDKGLEVTGQIDDALLEALGMEEETMVEATGDASTEATEGDAAEGDLTSAEIAEMIKDPDQFAELYPAMLMSALTIAGVTQDNAAIVVKAKYYPFKPDKENDDDYRSYRVGNDDSQISLQINGFKDGDNFKAPHDMSLDFRGKEYGSALRLDEYYAIVTFITMVSMEL